jgi:ubiquinone biosynthesis protein
LRRLPRRIDRITAALETGRLTTGVRLGVDPSLNRRIDDVTDLLVLAFLGPALGAVSAMLLGLPRSPDLTPDLSLYQLLGYAGLCISFAILFRVIAEVLRHRRA